MGYSRLRERPISARLSSLKLVEGDPSNDFADFPSMSSENRRVVSELLVYQIVVEKGKGRSRLGADLRILSLRSRSAIESPGNDLVECEAELDER